MGETILVTGGAGFIGSHTCVELLAGGYEVVVVDNLANSSREALRRVEQITGRSLTFEPVDILDARGLDRVFAAHPCAAVIHFAGLKSVGESAQLPLEYYHVNVGGTVSLLQAMQRAEVKRLVFSSSATVYGDPARSPVTEDFPLQGTNPYGRTKLMIEDMLRDLASSEPAWRIIPLRYFNPVGAHESGQIGEDPSGVPNNLMPYVMQVAVGKRDHVNVFGSDYPTRDGTGVRDYIHVVDLARGHLAALRALDEIEGCAVFNLGSGQGHSVLELLDAAGKAVGREIPRRIVDRRPGDAAECFADPGRAASVLGWTAERDLQQMCADAWRWQSRNPNGFEER